MNSDASSASSESTDINFSLIGPDGVPKEFKSARVLSDGKHHIVDFKIYTPRCNPNV